MWRLEEVAVRHGTEDADEDARQDECSEQTLQEDRVLNLAKRRLLDPNLAVEDFADDVAFRVLGDPGLVLERVGAGANKRIVRGRLFVGERHFVGGVGEQLPWAQVAMVHAVQDDTHAFPSSNECSNTDEPANEGKDAPAAASR
jgi:hypothetical protein